ncbi:MAG: hypothetical protein AAB323_01690, partial [Pseudomonadota bacterium]
MLFELCQGWLMWEDLRFRTVSPVLCVIAIACGVFQGGAGVLLFSILFSFLLIPAAIKHMIGFIDVIFMGVYAGLLVDITLIGHFFLLAGGLGILWTCFKKTPIPL